MPSRPAGPKSSTPYNDLRALLQRREFWLAVAAAVALAYLIAPRAKPYVFVYKVRARIEPVNEHAYGGGLKAPQNSKTVLDDLAWQLHREVYGGGGSPSPSSGTTGARSSPSVDGTPSSSKGADASSDSPPADPTLPFSVRFPASVPLFGGAILDYSTVPRAFSATETARRGGPSLDAAVVFHNVLLTSLDVVRLKFANTGVRFRGLLKTENHKLLLEMSRPPPEDNAKLGPNFLRELQFGMSERLGIAAPALKDLGKIYFLELFDANALYFQNRALDQAQELVEKQYCLHQGGLFERPFRVRSIELWEAKREAGMAESDLRWGLKEEAPV